MSYGERWRCGRSWNTQQIPAEEYEGLIELAAERRPGRLVFGPDRSRMSRRAYRRAAAALRERAPCLVWLGPSDAIE